MREETAMRSVLDYSQEEDICRETIDVLQDAGYTNEEIIPGLMRAVMVLASKTPYPETTLDEVANLLDEG